MELPVVLSTYYYQRDWIIDYRMTSTLQGSANGALRLPMETKILTSIMRMGFLEDVKDSD